MPRTEPPDLSLGSSEPVDEVERLRRLREQDGKPTPPPASLQGLLAEDGSIPAWKVKEAVSVWQSARVEVGEVGGYEAAERLLFLTVLLAGHFGEQSDPLRQRAMFESALEVFTLPRHVQIVRGYLARSAVWAGDLDAAESWLAPCDARSDDLQTDAAYRLSRAFLDTARRDFAAVLDVLGSRADEAPLPLEMHPTATLLRAHAWESRGVLDRAVGQLLAAMKRGQRRELELGLQRLEDWNLCALAYPEAVKQHRAASTTAARSSPATLIAWSFLGLAGFLGLIALGLVVGGLVCLGIALISVVLPAVVGGGEEAWITGGALGFSLAVTGVSLIAPGVSMVPFVVIPGWIGRRMLARARQNVELHDRGVEVQAEVVSVRATGAKVDGVPQYRIELRIPRDLGEPATHTAELPLTPLSYRRLQPGATLPVLVHPDDPSRVHLQL